MWPVRGEIVYLSSAKQRLALVDETNGPDSILRTNPEGLLRLRLLRSTVRFMPAFRESSKFVALLNSCEAVFRDRTRAYLESVFVAIPR